MRRGSPAKVHEHPRERDLVGEGGVSSASLACAPLAAPRTPGGRRSAPAGRRSSAPARRCPRSRRRGSPALHHEERRRSGRARRRRRPITIPVSRRGSARCQDLGREEVDLAHALLPGSRGRSRRRGPAPPRACAASSRLELRHDAAEHVAPLDRDGDPLDEQVEEAIELGAAAGDRARARSARPAPARCRTRARSGSRPRTAGARSRSPRAVVGLLGRGGVASDVLALLQPLGDLVLDAQRARDREGHVPASGRAGSARTG